MPDDHKTAMVYGINAVGELIAVRSSGVQQLLVDRTRSDARVNHLLEKARAQNLDVELVDRQQIDRLVEGQGVSDKVNHQGVLAVCRESEPRNEQFLKALVKRLDSPFILLLDGVTDPHNLGACLRSANAAGVDAVVVPKDNAVGLTPVVRKVASGAAEVTPLVQVSNFARCLQQLKDAGVWVMGAAGETDTALYDLDFKGGLGLVLGAEGRGLRRLTREHCDHLFAIPMYGSVESLNVSVAAGISLFEAARQRSSAR